MRMCAITSKFIKIMLFSSPHKIPISIVLMLMHIRFMKRLKETDLSDVECLQYDIIHTIAITSIPILLAVLCWRNRW